MQSRKLIDLIVFLLSVVALPAERITFNRDIRPILSENCFACHGPDKNARQADLRLDLRQNAIARGVIKPNNPVGSKLVARIQADQEILRMPPVWSNKHLTSEQQQTLILWIEQGAPFETHWAYIPPKRPEVPSSFKAIDFFINKALNDSGLIPAAEADRRTLARRLSFDLLGLPPKKEMVENFVKDPDPKAYEKLLDRLLGSLHFGERMAVHWLDLVRYADTVGFHGDVAVNVYPFRDYVIRSFNENKPFDQFTREQIAGDLIPNASIDQLVASAYNRLNRMTNEGGSQAKEYLAKYAADRVRTTSTVWLGSTLGCAECHDHKFDPFSTKDFYAMQAFFADIEEEGVFSGYGDWGSKIQVPPFEIRNTIDSLEKQIKELSTSGHNKLEENDINLNTFVGNLKANLDSWVILEPLSVTPVCDDPDVDGCESFDLPSEAGLIRVQPKNQGKVQGNLSGTIVGKAEIQIPKGSLSSLMIEVLEVEDSMDFFLAEFQITIVRSGKPERPVPIGTFLPDWESPGLMLRDTTDGNYHTGWGGKPCDEGARQAVFILEKAIDLQEGDHLFVTTIFDRVFGLKGLPIKYRLWAGNSEFPEIPPHEMLWPALLDRGEWTEAHRTLLSDVFV